MDVLGFEERGIQRLWSEKALDSSFRWNDEVGASGNEKPCSLLH
ncbi:hypothetical protein [Dyella sp.]|nr:hypothetical protein [Dyella sp.]HKT27680.1 hypothetical protein [Dyella sp.]